MGINYSRLIEGYSNFENNLTQFVIGKVKLGWDKIVKRVQNGKRVDLKISYPLDPPVTLKDFGGRTVNEIIINLTFDPNYQRISGLMRRQYGNQFKISIDPSSYKYDLSRIAGVLAHEITHAGQYMNNFMEYDRKKYVPTAEDQAKYMRGGTFHSRRETEKEATLIELFEMMRQGNYKKAFFDLLKDSSVYFNMFTFKDYISKGTAYGLKRSQFDAMKKEAENWIEDMIEEARNRAIEHPTKPIYNSWYESVTKFLNTNVPTMLNINTTKAMSELKEIERILK